ncbi:uncharacterized protein BDR25DRAFT_356502 [Lindgomyces ingoldianus]|uniref:Uncharacterized protein n=1 Tax=Lindgomyces ingoldianus TaxID=673940 RepID=A0ACB6QRV5_9PLEO|nr:uncharacterized protein BDR25DRAFT_356502 [Lindgomyces ingoldianus]KAF2469255.1 hypothetical protein BDR25DRAFT_356502 [Lindgomyces ingoldianus]
MLDLEGKLAKCSASFAHQRLKPDMFSNSMGLWAEFEATVGLREEGNRPEGWAASACTTEQGPLLTLLIGGTHSKSQQIKSAESASKNPKSDLIKQRIYPEPTFSPSKHDSAPRSISTFSMRLTGRYKIAYEPLIDGHYRLEIPSWPCIRLRFNPRENPGQHRKVGPD